jgi:cellulose synthase (UDP-forming)
MIDAPTDGWRAHVGPWRAAGKPYNGPFLLGMYTPEANSGYLPADYWSAEHKLGVRLRIVSLYQAWGPASLTAFPGALFEQIRQHGAIPMITWEPWSSPFPEFRSDRDLAHNRRIFRAIAQGRCDSYIAAYARRLRACQMPVFLRFAHEPDNPGYPWSATGGSTPDEYVAGWRHVVEVFRREGASNVSFVWNPWHPEGVRAYFPGASYVDWCGLTLLNYGRAYRTGQWSSFEGLYNSFGREFVKLGIDKPTMLAEFGSTDYGGDRARWLARSIESIAVRHPEIRAAVFLHSCDPKWPTSWRPPGNPRCIEWRFLSESTTLSMLHPILSQPQFHDRQFQTEPVR